MTTAREMLTGALRLIRVIAEEETPNDVALADGLTILNETLHSFKAHGADLGFQDITLDDAVPVPKELVRGFRYIMAAELAPEYGATLTPEVNVRETEARTTVAAYYTRIGVLRVEESFQERTGRHAHYDGTE